MDNQTIIKYLRDAIPQGEHAAPWGEFITVRLDVVQASAEAIDVATTKAKQAEAARATARDAIRHLQAVLNRPRTHAQQQAADTAARDWLLSIGSEP